MRGRRRSLAILKIVEKVFFRLKEINSIKISIEFRVIKMGFLNVWEDWL